MTISSQYEVFFTCRSVCMAGSVRWRISSNIVIGPHVMLIKAKELHIEIGSQTARIALAVVLILLVVTSAIA